MLRRWLYGSVFFGSSFAIEIIAAGAGHAQTVMNTARTSTAGTGSAASTGSPAAPEEDVVVRAGAETANGVTNTTPGGGLMPVQTAAKSVSGLTRDFIAKQSPTSNVNSLVADLPGVVSAGNDPFGLSTNGLSVRGLDQTEVGYVFEGIPLADPVNYAPFTTDFADTDNLQSVTLSQGAPDISSPVYNAVGGEISEMLRDPGYKPGGMVDLSYGSRRLNREFARIDTGSIGNSGIRAFASYSYTSADLWRGPGGVTRSHVDAKAVKEWGDGNRVSAVFTWNRQQANAYDQPSLAQYQQLGRSFNYNATYSPNDPNYFKLNVTQRHDLVVILPTKLTLTDALKLEITPYYVGDSGPQVNGENISQNDSTFGTTAAGPLNQPFATNGVLNTVSVDPYDQKTGGVNAILSWTRGHNTLSGGYWYAYTAHREEESFSTVDLNGNVSNSFGRFPIRVNGNILSGYNINFKQQVNSAFINDKYEMLDGRLTLNAGFREVLIGRTATNLIPGANYRNGSNDAQPLPQLSASFKLTRNDQIYADVTTAFRELASVEAYVDIFDPNGAGKPVEARGGDLKPEYSIGEEFGYRHYGPVNFSAAFFNYNLTNHQITSSSFVDGALLTTPINVGGETARGVQAEIGARPWHHFSPYLSGQYLHATIDNDFRVGNDFLKTTGKTSVMSPKFTGSIGLAYDNGSLFGNFAFNYVDSQYSTFLNDESIPSYETANMTLGYRFRTLGPAQHPQIQLNLINIGDKNYLSGLYGVSGTAKGATGKFGTKIAGASPTYYVGGGFAAVVNLSSAF